MGQIVGRAAKPKRCNLNKLSQLGTPAAGEHILVSSDNSMNAAGQGDFDSYIVGDGTKAATVLKLKRIISADDAVIGIKTDKITRTLDEVCTKKTGLKFTGDGVITSQGAYPASDTIYFSKTLMKKGTIVSFVGEITTNSNYYVVSFGFSTTNPNELQTIEGLTLTNVLSDTIHKEERSLYYVMPNDGYVFLYYYHYSGDYWKTRDYKIYLTDDYITEIDVTQLNGGASYNDLTAALSAVPTSCRIGGITIRFINSNTSKYTQYNLKTSTWSTDIADWQEIFTEEKFKSNFDAYSDKVAFEREDVGSVVSEWQTNDSSIWLITNVDGHNATLTNVTKTTLTYVGLNISRIPANSHVHLRLKNEGKFNSSQMSLFANLSYQSWAILYDIYGNIVYPTSDGYLDFVFLKPENANWLVLSSNSFPSGTVFNITDFLIERQIDINSSKKVIDEVETLPFTTSVIPPNYTYSEFIYFGGKVVTQGSCVYGNYFFGAHAANGQGELEIMIFDLSSPNDSYIGTFVLSGVATNTHANTISFSGTKYDESDVFPLLYVPSLYVQDGGMSDVYVVRLTGSLDNIIATIIQTIHLDLGGTAEWVCDADNNRAWVRMGDPSKSTFTCYDIPAIGQSEITIDDNTNTLEKFTLPPQKFGFDTTTSSNQGCMYDHGRIWLASGVPTWSGQGVNSTYICAINVRSKCREVVIWLDDLGLGDYEPEGVFIWNNQLYLALIEKIVKIEKIDLV